MRRILSIFDILYRSVTNTVAHGGIEYAGYIAFLTILSLFPFLIFTVNITTYLGNRLEIGPEIEILLAELLKNVPDTISGLKPRISEIVSEPSFSLMTIATVNILWTSSSIIEGMRTVLNIAARVEVAPPYILRRMLSVAQFLLVSILLTASCILYSARSWVTPYLLDYLGINLEFILHSSYLGALLILVITVWLYRALPSKKQCFVSIATGGVLVVFIWKLSIICFGFFLKSFSALSLIYGGLGSIIISLLLFYILALGFIFGAEFINQLDRVIVDRNIINED